MKTNKKIRENFNSSDDFSKKLINNLKQFVTKHQFDNIEYQFTPEQVSIISNKMKQWEKLSASETAPQIGDHNYEEKTQARIGVENEIISTIESFTKNETEDKKDIEISDNKNDVPTVAFEGRKFKNLKTFHELMEEQYSSPMAKIKNQAKSEIRNKIKDISNKIFSKDEPVKTEKDISVLKSEIAAKMKNLDDIFQTNKDNIEVQTQEVKQLVEKLNILLNKLK